MLEPDTYTKDETNWKMQAMRVTKDAKGVDAKEFYATWEQGTRGGAVVTANVGPMLQQEINDRDDRDHREAMWGDYEDGEFVRDDEESESEQEGEVSPAGGCPL